MGDFYETFDDDARTASRELDLVLTSKAMGKNMKVPLAGIPAHSLEPYLTRLIKKGHKVAICEQLSDPAASKGLVERDVVRVVTPGTVVEPSLLKQKANNYLAAVCTREDVAGLAYVDISTGEFRTTQVSVDDLPPELDRLSPAELLTIEGADFAPDLDGCSITEIPASTFKLNYARDHLMEHYKVATLEAFGCEQLPMAMAAAGMVLGYLERTQKAALAELSPLATYSAGEYMVLDQQTRRNLELFQVGRGAEGASLLSILDLTRTSMGGRLLRRWLGQPLLDLEEVQQRQDGVEELHNNLHLRERVMSQLAHVSDIERVLHRIGAGTALPRELLGLKASLEAGAAIVGLIGVEEGSAALGRLVEGVRPLDDVVALVDRAIDPEPSGEVGDGRVIASGFSDELDDLRSGSRNAHEYIAGLEHRERGSSGIKGLKVGYNKVFGYYIEVSNSNLDQVPDSYVRRQTLVGGERFITPELKEYESLILNAREHIERLEGDLYRRVCGQIAQESKSIASLADCLAHVDALASLAEAAHRYRYVRPQLNKGDGIEIKGGRHPVVEQMVPAGTYVPNDCALASGGAQMILLTGPNMAGKSTYIRQIALIVLLAQVGSYVPADSATIGLVDRIFTRVGQQDDLAKGQSTFMVEMVETSAILNQATPRSLVVLDEVGRGTSTYDGLSIARAAAEYIHNSPGLGCKTLFATHYHELTKLAGVLPRVRNYNVAVTEEDGRVVFLHQIVPGGADKSYGIHVAQLAGLPRPVVNRAWEVLEELENQGPGAKTAVRPFEFPQGRRRSKGDGDGSVGAQMPLFGGQDPVVEHLLGVDVSSMTPLEAINLLYDLQSKARENQGGTGQLGFFPP